MPTRLEMVWKHVRGLPRPEFDQNALHGSRLWIVELVVVVLSRGSPNGGGGTLVCDTSEARCADRSWVRRAERVPSCEALPFLCQK